MTIPRFTDILDILIVFLVVYKFITLIRGTRAVQLIKGVVILFLAYSLSEWFQLFTIQWLLGQVVKIGIVAIPIVFQPELRRALEQLGRGQFFSKPIVLLDVKDMEKLIGELIRAIQVLTKNKIGALVVLERETGLKDFIETGSKIDGLVTAELLTNIFIPNTPLHDGAVIIRGDRVVSAGSFLPLTENPNVDKSLGTRHRAALGITEQSDAVVIVVSEETGVISLVSEGRIIRYLDDKTLKERLFEMFVPKSEQSFSFWRWR